MIEITCDKCKRKVAVNTKSVTAKTLEKCGFEAVSLDKEKVYHLCFYCLEDIKEWADNPDLIMG